MGTKTLLNHVTGEEVIILRHESSIAPGVKEARKAVLYCKGTGMHWYTICPLEY